MASGFKFSKRSLGNLDEVHPALQRVAKRALEISEVDFLITDGHRTVAEQRRFVAQGKSKTMKSKHLEGRAIDYVAWENGTFTYNVAKMTAIARAFKQASKELSIPIEWGGDWKNFKDTPHIQLGASVKGSWPSYK